MTQQIKLTRGQLAIVDDWWYEELNQYKWNYDGKYASTTIKQIKFRMHRIILGSTSYVVDHINHDTLDNREENLRICNKTQNGANRGKQQNNTSGYKGVTWNKHAGKWLAQIKKDQKSYYLGIYDDAQDAARAYDVRSRMLFGEFAILNFPDNEQRNR